MRHTKAHHKFDVVSATDPPMSSPGSGAASQASRSASAKGGSGESSGDSASSAGGSGGASSSGGGGGGSQAVDASGMITFGVTVPDPAQLLPPRLARIPRADSTSAHKNYRDWKARAGRGDGEAALLLGTAHSTGNAVLEHPAAESTVTRYNFTNSLYGAPEQQQAAYWPMVERGVGRQSGRIPSTRAPSTSDDPYATHTPTPLPDHTVPPPNDAKAAAYYKKASDLGAAQGQYNLAVSYFTGTGVEKNAERALKYYQKAADQGHADALNALGFCHRYALGTSVDLVRAARCYLMAAQQGHAEAQCAIGLCYRDGIGVRVDPEAGEKWIRRSAAQRCDEAVSLVQRFYDQKTQPLSTPWATTADKDRVSERRAIEEQIFPQAPPPRHRDNWDPAEQRPARETKPQDRFSLYHPVSTDIMHRLTSEPFATKTNIAAGGADLKAAHREYLEKAWQGQT